MDGPGEAEDARPPVRWEEAGAECASGTGCRGGWISPGSASTASAMRRAVRVTATAGAPSSSPECVATTPEGVASRSRPFPSGETWSATTVPGVAAAIVSATLPVIARAGCT